MYVDRERWVGKVEILSLRNPPKQLDFADKKFGQVT
jgi:hypothetical protein